MRRWVIAGLLGIVTVSGCASMKATPSSGPDVAQGVAPASGSRSPPPPPTGSGEPESSANGGSDRSSVPATTPAAVAAAPSSPPLPLQLPAEPPRQAPPTAGAADSSSDKTKISAANRPVKQSGTAAHSQPAAPTTSGKPPPVSSSPSPSPAPATLNLADLEQRLRDTRAIGVFTKLSLKNQVDDLLTSFRTFYKASNKHPTAELRQRYDELLLKVLALLQNSDPPLAAAISSSREAIWSILADPDKFAKI